jgi:hypothetical protein
MAVTTILAAVSFQDTPLSLISEKADKIAAAGWTQYATVGEGWVAKFEKLVPEGSTSDDAEQELREIMGEHWRDLDPPGDADQLDQQLPPDA